MQHSGTSFVHSSPLYYRYLFDIKQFGPQSFTVHASQGLIPQGALWAPLCSLLFTLVERAIIAGVPIDRLAGDLSQLPSPSGAPRLNTVMAQC